LTLAYRENDLEVMKRIDLPSDARPDDAPKARTNRR
jgi:hypothetical protein